MFNKLTYKKRLYYLIASGFLAYLFSYWIAVSGTVNTRHELRRLDSQMEKLATAKESISMLERSMAVADSKLGENPGDIPEFQKKLFDRISSYCAQNGLVLKDFPKVHSVQKKDFQFITGYANIEGPFISLLKLLYQLETSNASGRIISVTFASTEDRRLKKTRLTMSVYVQTIKQISHVGTK